MTAVAVAPAPPRPSRWIVRRYVLPAAGILALLLAWEAYTRAFKVPDYLVPAPSLIARTLVEEWPTIRRNVGRTLVEAVGGFVLGNGFAVLLAIWFVHSPGVQRVLYPVAVAIRTVPISHAISAATSSTRRVGVSFMRSPLSSHHVRRSHRLRGRSSDRRSRSALVR